MIYLDSSALLKLVLAERESAALEKHLSDSAHRTSCALARVEVVRAARKRHAETVERAWWLLRRVSLITITEPLLEVAADIGDPWLRSLDAIHVAAALSLGDDLAEFITYDRRMTDAASALGLPVASPT